MPIKVKIAAIIATSAVLFVMGILIWMALENPAGSALGFGIAGGALLIVWSISTISNYFLDKDWEEKWWGK